jgi:hypothetical protein
VPYLPEGSAWVVRYEVVVDGSVERRVSDLLTPETLYLAIPGWLPAAEPVHSFPGSCRVEGRKRFSVRVSDEDHAHLAAVLATSRWSVVDLLAHLQARELRAMLEGPDPEERRWAQRAIRTAPRDVDDGLGRLREQEAWAGPRVSSPAAAGGAGEPPWQLTVRAFTGPRTFLRDVAVHYGKGSRVLTPDGLSLSASRHAYLDDTQVSIIARAREKSAGLRDNVDHAVEVRPGHALTLDLGAVGRLVVEPEAFASRRFLGVYVAMRRLDGPSMRFHPHKRCIVPNGGSTLFTLDDHVGEPPATEETGFVVLTLEAPDGREAAPDPAPLTIEWR